MRTRILVADDHDVVRKGLRALIEVKPDWEICGEADNGVDALELARKCKPDIAVLDVSMPKLNGLECARRILRLIPKTEILILTMHESEQIVHDVLDAGVHGYVLKTDAGRNLISAIEALLRHEPYFTSQISQIVLDGYRRERSRAKKLDDVRNLFTSREREILQLLAEGRTNKEVAVALKLSPKTVEAHRGNIMRKANLHSLSDLIHFAIRNKFINP